MFRMLCTYIKVWMYVVLLRLLVNNDYCTDEGQVVCSHSPFDAHCRKNVPFNSISVYVSAFMLLLADIVTPRI